MTFHSLVKIFLLAFNAALPFGFGLFLLAGALKNSVEERSGVRPTWLAAALFLLIVPWTVFFLPSLSLPLFTPPSHAFQVNPFSSDSLSGNADEIIPAVITAFLPPSWTWAAVIWLGVAALLLVRMGVSLAAAHRLGEKAEDIHDRRILSLFRESARIVECRRPVALKTSPWMSAPSSLGLFRGTVVLPEDLSSWSDAEIRCVFHHELTHIKNRDLFWRLSIRLACSMVWFNPAVWLAFRRLMAAQELVCDRAALRSGARPSLYAGLLMKSFLGKRSRLLPKAAVASFDSGAALKSRLRSFLDPRRTHPGQGRKRAWILVPAFLVVAAMSVFGIWDAAWLGPRKTTITKVRLSGGQTFLDDPASRRAGIWVDEKTHRWGWR